MKLFTQRGDLLRCRIGPETRNSAISRNDLENDEDQKRY